MGPWVAGPPWCNGSTSDFGSDGPGSNPGGGAAGQAAMHLIEPCAPRALARDDQCREALRKDCPVSAINRCLYGLCPRITITCLPAQDISSNPWRVHDRPDQQSRGRLRRSSSVVVTQASTATQLYRARPPTRFLHKPDRTPRRFMEWT